MFLRYLKRFVALLFFECALGSPWCRWAYSWSCSLMDCLEGGVALHRWSEYWVISWLIHSHLLFDHSVGAQWTYTLNHRAQSLLLLPRWSETRSSSRFEAAKLLCNYMLALLGRYWSLLLHRSLDVCINDIPVIYGIQARRRKVTVSVVCELRVFSFPRERCRRVLSCRAWTSPLLAKNASIAVFAAPCPSCLCSVKIIAPMLLRHRSESCIPLQLDSRGYSLSSRYLIFQLPLWNG